MGFHKSKSAKPEVEPTEADLRWVAGVLDGEGSFGFSRTPQVRAFQSDRNKSLLDGLLRFFGGSIRATSPKGRQVQWTWGLYGKPAYDLMRRLRPFLGPYRQGQIDRAVTAADGRVTWSIERRAAKAEMARRVLVPYNRGRVVSAETRQKVREATKRWWASASVEKKAKVLANLTGGEQTEARRKNLSVAIQRAWAAGKFGLLPGPKVEHAKEGSPEAREKRRRARLGKTNSPEHRAKLSAGLAAWHEARRARETLEERVAYSARMSERARQAWREGKYSSPEHGAKISAGLKRAWQRRKEIESRATVEDTGRTAEEAG